MSYDITGQENWDPENFSNPNVHNPNDYIYIVTAVTSDDRNSQSMSEHLSQFADEFHNPSHTRDPFVDIYSHPEQIANKGVISGSIITPKNTATFRDVGYILRVPKENILAASSGDLYINNCSSKANISRFSKSHLQTPKEICNYKGLEGHRQFNEVVILGKTPYGQVEVIGVFYKRVNGQEKESGLQGEAEILAIRAGNVPIIAIDEPEKKFDDSIDLHTWDRLKNINIYPLFLQ